MSDNEDPFGGPREALEPERQSWTPTRVREYDLDRLRAEVDRLRAALRGLMMMIENGYLVRDTSKDGEPDYVVRMIPLVKVLAEAEAALAKGEP